MLREMKNVRQNEAGVLRRWFSDDYFDLIVWTDAEGKPFGFQLCYDLDNRERALTYLNGGYRHTKIDTGDDLPTDNKTPLLSADGVFDTRSVLDRFVAASAEIDGAIRQYVVEGIEGYGA